MLVKKSKPFVLSSKEDGCALQEKAKKSKPFVLLLICCSSFFLFVLFVAVSCSFVMLCCGAYRISRTFFVIYIITNL